jgi:hypothetical protein
MQCEADDRNVVLALMYGQLPFIAMFRECDIAQERYDKRLQWWKSFINNNNSIVRAIAKKWLQHIACGN